MSRPDLPRLLADATELLDRAGTVLATRLADMQTTP